MGKILVHQWPDAIEVEVEIGAHGVFLLPLGIGREGKCMGTGLESCRGPRHHEPV